MESMSIRNKLSQLIENLESILDVYYQDDHLESEQILSAKKDIAQHVDWIFGEYTSGVLGEVTYSIERDRALMALLNATGCSEDLEIFDDICDSMIKKRVITRSQYQDLLEKAPVNRWL